MMVKYKEKIGDYTVIRLVTDAVCDPEKTKKKIKPMITPGMTREDIRQLYMNNLVTAKYGLIADIVEDAEGKIGQQKIKEKGENQLLLDNNEYIDDYRGVEYHIKKSGKWKKERIEDIGISLPLDAVLQENLSKEQQKEISIQQEDERVAALTPEQKTEEKNNRLRAAAREAIMKAEEEELLGETFDKQAWLQPKRAEIEAKYA